jgi:hypothetical protein
MPDTCPNCQTPLPPGATTCAVCDPPAPAVPARDPVTLAPAEDTPPPQPTNHTLGVLAAFSLPVIATVVIVSLLGVIGYGVFNLLHRLVPKPPATPAAVSNRASSHLDTVPNPPAAPPVEPPQTLVARPSPTAAAQTPPTTPAVVPAPEMTGYTATGFGKGMLAALNGDNLDRVTRVELISSAGARSADAKIVEKSKAQIVIEVPAISFEDDDIILAAFSPGGVALLIDEHTGATPWGTDGHLHDTTVIAKTGDSIDTLLRMVVLAQPSSTVSMGDNSIAFLSDHVTLAGHGKHCKIYYVAPIALAPGVSKDGLIEVPSIDVQAPGPAFRVKLR